MAIDLTWRNVGVLVAVISGLIHRIGFWPCAGEKKKNF